MPIIRTFAFPLLTAVLAATAIQTQAQAQGLDAAKGVLGGEQQSAAPGQGSPLGALGGGALGGGSMPSLGSVGTGNLAGVIGYCAKNNYLGGDAAGIQEKLMGQLGGEQQAQSDPGYQEGLNGVLGGQSDQKLDLSGDGLKAQLTEQVCDQVLEHGKSLL